MSQWNQVGKQRIWEPKTGCPVRVPCNWVCSKVWKDILQVLAGMFFWVTFGLWASVLPDFSQCTCVTLIIRENMLVPLRKGRQSTLRQPRGGRPLPFRPSAPDAAPGACAKRGLWRNSSSQEEGTMKDMLCFLAGTEWKEMEWFRPKTTARRE